MGHVLWSANQPSTQPWQNTWWPSQSRRIIILPTSMSSWHTLHRSPTSDSSAGNCSNFSILAAVRPCCWFRCGKSGSNLSSSNLAIFIRPLSRWPTMMISRWGLFCCGKLGAESSSSNLAIIICPSSWSTTGRWGAFCCSSFPWWCYTILIKKINKLYNSFLISISMYNILLNVFRYNF